MATGSEHLVYQGNLGDAWRQLGQTARAREAYDKATTLGRHQLEVNPEDADTRGNFAMSLAGAGRCDEARKEARRAVADAPDRPVVSYYASVAFAVCGDRALAVEQAVRAIRGDAVVDVSTNPDLKPLLDEPAIRKALEDARARP